MSKKSYSYKVTVKRDGAKITLEHDDSLNLEKALEMFGSVLRGAGYSFDGSLTLEE